MEVNLSPSLQCDDPIDYGEQQWQWCTVWFSGTLTFELRTVTDN